MYYIISWLKIFVHLFDCTDEICKFVLISWDISTINQLLDWGSADAIFASISNTLFFHSATFSLQYSFRYFSSPHCVKRVLIQGYFDPYFPAFELNTERCSVSLSVQPECGKIRTRITPNMDTFSRSPDDCSEMSFAGSSYVYINTRKLSLTRWYLDFFIHNYLLFVWLRIIIKQLIIPA